ncbi:MAG: uncharacterized protein KVP18_000536 [Porospora cf. gigantea A]|uniref:uncharacterized protein n=2 Tax=Porospora cf. gigantea A TaxID=2853593 RepID=UPI00355A6F28|nr:MAG: hypothetical protein KVP18_000536 [Porospora cf. gigantea A]
MTKTIVVGGGMAGLSAALHLNGVDVTILESSNRLGGRVKTQHLNGWFVEHGATWLHGTDSDLYRQLSRWNIEMDSSNPLGADPLVMIGRRDHVFVDEYGHKLDQNTVDLGLSLFVEAVKVQNLRAQKSSAFGRALDESFAALCAVKGIERDLQLDMIFDWCKRNRLSDEGCVDLDQASICDDDIDGNYFTTVPKGWSHVIDRMEEEVKAQGVDILMERAVESIRFKDGKIWLTDNTGVDRTADHVILAVPLNELQRLVNQLPVEPKRLKALNQFGMAQMTKIILRYTQPWWGPMTSFNFLTRRLPQLQRPNPPSANWTDNICSLEVFRQDFNALLVFVSGRDSVAVEQLSPEEIQEDLYVMMRPFFVRPIPLPMQVLVTNFSQEPRLNGSWALPPLDVDVHDVFDCIEDGKAKVFIAGEHSAARNGTVDGAYDEGKRAAQSVMAALQGPCVCSLFCSPQR